MQTKHDSGGLESAIFIFIRFIYIGKPSVVLDNSVPIPYLRFDEMKIHVLFVRS